MNITSRIAPLIERWGLLLIFIGVVLFFWFNTSTPQFSSSANIKVVLANNSLAGIIAIATTIPLVANQIDLSVGPIAGFSSIVASGLMSQSDKGLLVSAAAAIGIGLAAGILNGLLVAKLGINAIITTLGTSSVLVALILWYSEGVAFYTHISEPLLKAGTGTWLGLPKPFIYLAVLALVAWYLLEHTPGGRNLEAVGINPRAADLVGINVPRLVFSSFVIAGFLAGLAGLLFVAVQGGGNPQVGANFTLPAIAAVFLGATTIRPGRYNIAGTVLAVFFLAVTVNGLTLAGAKGWVTPFFNGSALIIAVGISVYYGRRRAGQAKVIPAAPSDEADLDNNAERA
jgi:ribose transport system permease protein